MSPLPRHPSFPFLCFSLSVLVSYLFYFLTLFFACVLFLRFIARVYYYHTNSENSSIISCSHGESLGEEILLDDDPVPPTPKAESCNLVVRVISEKVFSGLSLKMNIGRLIWHVRGFSFQDLGENKFVLWFNHKLDCGIALEGSPWLINRCAMQLQRNCWHNLQTQILLQSGTDWSYVLFQTWCKKAA